MISTAALLPVALALLNFTEGSFVDKPYAQNAVDQSNILRHLAGTGPFVEAAGHGIPSATPDQCVVDQVHLFMRHGERYPTKSVGAKLETLLDSLQESEAELRNSSTPVVGPLDFVGDYTYFVPSASFLEQETFSGPYAGSADAYAFGAYMRNRYSHLVNSTEKLPIFSAGKKRVVDTAKKFAEGFTFDGRYQNYTMVVLPETQDYGMNSLTNAKSCKNFDKDHEGPLVNISLAYKTIETQRLNRLSPGFNITESDIFNMGSYCGLEMNAIGNSKFCDALSMEAVIGFGYERDLNYYYSNGPGYNMSYVSGSVYANATATLLAESSDDAGSLFFSFSHDNDLVRYLTALGLYDDDEPLPVDYVDFRNHFKSSEIVPMGGRLITERLNCYNETSETTDQYVRLILNDQVLPFGDCTSGPGFSCPLETYLETVDSMVYDFPSECAMNSSTPDYVSFYWDWTENIYPTTYDK